MNKAQKKIETGSKIAIIGGGPAGCFFALYLRRYAEERNIHPEITIYQERDFNELGPKGCKGCAAILSISMIKNLRELGLRVPDEVIQSWIKHYAVHSPHTAMSISNPVKTVQIASVYRGGGPQISHYEMPISFDGWLLSQAKKQDSRVINQAVSGIYLGEEPAVEAAGEKSNYDLVVLASGVNSKTIPITGLDYVPPETRTMSLSELYIGASQVKSRLGHVAHAFLIPHSRIIFGTLVPKGPFINVSVISNGQRPVSAKEFLNLRTVQSILPKDYQVTCNCKPKTLIGAARNYYTDGFVAIGDAAITRLYKDGIGSSLLSAREAARVTIHHGPSQQSFERYYQPFCQEIQRDNRWGKLLFSINNRTKDSRLFMLTQQRLIGDEHDIRGSSPFTKSAWGMFSGGYTYKKIAMMSFAPVPLIRLFTALIGESFTALFHRELTDRRRLHVGSRKVLILGSGFGGTYALRSLVPSLNRNENVQITMVSDENFFLFSPLLHEVAMGGIETRHVAYPIRRLHWRDRFNFEQAEVKRIDLQERQVITTLGTLHFNYLVMALGSVANPPIAGSAAGKGNNLFTLRTLHDSMLVRNHIISAFEQASVEIDIERQQQLLTFVVAGAGYTGVQVIAELRDFIHKHIIRFYKTIAPENIRLILVEAEPKIIPELQLKLGAYVMKTLKEMNIEIRLKSRITQIWEDRVEINHTQIVPTSTLIWVAGVVAHPRIAELEVPRDKIGRVLVNEYMEVVGSPGVYAVGDCAHFVDPESGQPIPPRAHTAVRQAKIAAHNILSEIRGRDKKPYRYSNPVEMVSLGASKAAFGLYRLRLYGLPARLIWLGAYTLLVTGMYNRLRIVTDWLLSRLFGRDTTFLKSIK